MSEFAKENCWYKDVCNIKNCNSNCIRFLEMKNLIETANIPKGKQFNNVLIPNEIDVANFDFLKDIKTNIVNFVDNGENLYIYSSTFGNGKTTWAIKIMQNYFNKIWLGNGFKQRGLFIHTPSFITKFKEVMNKKDESFEDLKRQIVLVDLVIWDDIATGKLSEFDHTNLLTYIDQRKLNGKSNIYTGNLNEDELSISVGNRLKSRIWNSSIIVELKGNDRRGGTI